MLKRIVLSAVFKKEVEGGYSAFCPELGVASQGESIEEAEINLKEACELYIESAKKVGMFDLVADEISFEGMVTTPVLTGSITAEVTL